MAHSAPILSTPAEHILQEPTPQVVQSREQGVLLSEEQLYLQYEIKRTISEIRAGQWKRIALQFPDDMLVDAPRVFERLRDGLKHERAARAAAAASEDEKTEEKEEKLCILGDTSYGSCCVDEVAAEHTDADVVVHYGRACLSPTARLPVIYVFTAKSLHLDAVVASFKETYPPSSRAEEKVCLMADIPYSHHLDELYRRLTEEEGYAHVFKTSIIHDPASLIPNRTTPVTTTGGGEGGGTDEAATAALKEYSIFHISEPPTSLLLILSSRIKSLHIFPTTPSSSSSSLSSSSDSPPPPTHLASTTTTPLLRRRYALITRLSTIPIFGILINTLSVSHYLQALQHCQRIIHASGKKSYTFVVGKINAAKLANFAEIGGWVVIGCWESSLLENGSKEFFRPVITPWELEVALMRDRERVWGGEWVGDFGEVLERGRGKMKDQGLEGGEEGNHDESPTTEEEECPSDSDSESSPPDFDLRTGQYVSHSRPMGHPRRRQQQHSKPKNPNPQLPSTTTTTQLTHLPKTSSALTTPPFHINGHLSPAAEYLSSQRTWTGLGSDFSHSSLASHHADADADGASIAYERDENGKIRGAEMEEGRKGVAKGYRVGDGDDGREG
ncbi:2-(3-amino-3-carboxypropyl)histidine synthase [Sphaerulina musiva]